MSSLSKSSFHLAFKMCLIMHIVTWETHRDPELTQMKPHLPPSYSKHSHPYFVRGAVSSFPVIYYWSIAATFFKKKSSFVKCLPLYPFLIFLCQLPEYSQCFPCLCLLSYLHNYYSDSCVLHFQSKY